MIRPSDPDAISLAELAKVFRVPVGTVRNWAYHGIGGLKLETVKVGRLRRSTVEAAERFLAAAEAARTGRPAPAEPGPSKAALRADAALEAMGI